MWKEFGKELELQTLVPVQSDNQVILLAEYVHPGNGSHYVVEYQFNRKGEILVHAKFTPSEDKFQLVLRGNVTVPSATALPACRFRLA